MDQDTPVVKEDKYANLSQAAQNRGYPDICLEFCEDIHAFQQKDNHLVRFFVQECGMVGGTRDSPAVKAMLEYHEFCDGMRKLLAPL